MISDINNYYTKEFGCKKRYDKYNLCYKCDKDKCLAC